MHKVLLVLDSEDLSTILNKELSADFEIIVCDAATAADVIDHYRPDILILDLFLPGTDGFTILKNTKHQAEVIILLTVLATNNVFQNASVLDIDYIFLKPFKISALIDRLIKLLAINQ